MTDGGSGKTSVQLLKKTKRNGIANTMKGADNQRGVALLITITILFVVFIIVSEVNRHTRNSLKQADIEKTRARLVQMATSGIHLGIAVLMEDMKTSEIDSLQESWADPEQIEEVLSDYPFSDGEISLRIVDEIGKIQINALVDYPEGKKFNTSQKLLWETFLKLLNPPDESVDSLGLNADIVNCVKDWLDFGDDDATTGINGVEDEYYQSLDSPYSCKNGPLSDLGELVLIKGFTQEMVDRVEMGYRLGDLMTIYGMVVPEKAKGASQEKASGFTFPGLININTADLPVILSLMPDSKSFLENSTAAQAIYDYREERTEDGFVNELAGTWYENCPGCEDSGIKTDLLSTSSDFFTIECTAFKDKIQVIVKAVIRRDDKKGKYTVLSWKTE